MLGQQFGDGVIGLAVDGSLLNVDGERSVVVDLNQRAFAAAGLDADDDGFAHTVIFYRATITEEPWPNKPWLAVTPTFAPSTCRPVA